MGTLFQNVFSQNTAPQGGKYQNLSSYPDTELGWTDRYNRLYDCYLGHPYDVSEVKAYHLFRALDDRNEEIDCTKRVSTLYKFIVDTDVGGVLGGKLTLEVEDGEDAAATTGSQDAEILALRAQLLMEGESVWKRSGFHTHVENWVRMCAVLGDHYVEAVRTSSVKPYNTTLVGYDARNVCPVYDANTNTKLIKVIITNSYFDEPTVGDNGTVNEGALHTYRREVDAVNIKVWVDGAPVPELSGPHGLGAIPVVHLQWTPFVSPDHGLPAAVGIDQAVMAVDSMLTQCKAIYNRYANPIGFIQGAQAENSDFTKFGRFITGLPAEGKIGYLEAGGSMVGEITSTITAILEQITKTEPEFLFADSASTSGEARSYKAAAFENKIGNARMRIFHGLAEVTGYAVLLERDQAVDPNVCLFGIDAPPILPRNQKSELDMIVSVKDSLTSGDFVRHLQRLDIISSHEDPEAYVLKVKTAEPALKEEAKTEKPEDAVDPVDPEETPDVETEETLMTSTLMDSSAASVVNPVLEIVRQVLNKTLPRESGIAMMVELLHLKPEAAEAIMGTVGKGFELPAPSMP